MINRWIRDRVNLLIYGGSFIGLCAICISALSFELAGTAEKNTYYILFIGGITAALYCGHRVIGIRKLAQIHTSERFEVIRKYKKHIWIYTGMWLLFSLMILPQIFSFKLMAWLTPGGLIGLAYVIPILPGGIRLRDLGWMKILMVGWSWGWLTAFIPFWFFSDTSVQLAVIHGLERMLFIVLLAIPFEIRDIQIDRSVGLINLPAKLGKKKTLLLSLILAGLVVLLSGVSAFHYFSPAYAFTLAITCIILLILIRLSYTTSNEYFYSGLTDGIMILALWTYIILREII